MNAIETHGLTKQYKDVTAVDGLELAVRQGELFALLGVNGAGKTTTIKMLSCLTKPTAGDALLLGRSAVREPEAVKGLIAVSPQETAVAPKLTVEENLALMARIADAGRQTPAGTGSACPQTGNARPCKERVDALCDKLGLGEVRRKAAGKLSGGWQRRLSIAMALILEPKILFLDEPTLGLDVLARAELWDLIRSLRGEMTVILTTHYMEEAEALSDRIGVMGRGTAPDRGHGGGAQSRRRGSHLRGGLYPACKGGGKMKQTLLLSQRTAKEVLRDPLTLFFGLGFPLVVLGLLSAIQANIPDAVSLFAPEKLVPGITVFGLSFMTLFSALLVSRDRCSALLLRLYTTPLRPAHYIFGYLLPMLPMALAQTALCYAFGLVLGLPWRATILAAIGLNLPAALVFIALGLLCGSLLNDKQVGGVCGALLTNLSAWLSGIWFDVALVGGAFTAVAKVLPFWHAVELERAVYAGALSDALPHLWVVLAWAAALTAAAVWAFLHQMKKN